MDGQLLASGADLLAPQASLIHGKSHEKIIEMKPDAARRIEAFIPISPSTHCWLA